MPPRRPTQGTRKANRPWTMPAALCVAVLSPWSPVRADTEEGIGRYWHHATLYDSGEGETTHNLALSGRLQADGAWFDADEGDWDDTRWRRFRFGFKGRVASDWIAQFEGDFDLNESRSDWYTRITDAHIGWNPSNQIDLRLLKHSAGFTLDGATSSKKLLTPQRNNLTNNLWFTAEYFTGASVRGVVADRWSYRFGVFSSDPDDEVAASKGSYFTIASVGYDFGPRLGMDSGWVRVDYTYNDEDAEANTRDLSDVLSLSTKWQAGAWGLWTDLGWGNGYFDQSDILGFSVMPFYNHSKMLQWVARFTWLDSDDDNGLRLGKYENEIVDGLGDEYTEFFLGLNLFFYGHKLKWQSGIQYTSMNDDAHDGGDYDGWGFTTGPRLSW